MSKIQTLLHGGSMGGLINAVEEIEDEIHDIDSMRVWLAVARIEIEYLKKTIVNMQHAKTNEEKKQAIIDSIYMVFTFTYNIAMDCIEIKDKKSKSWIEKELFELVATAFNAGDKDKGEKMEMLTLAITKAFRLGQENPKF